MPALADPSHILQHQTSASNQMMVQYQNRNTAGRIFGGFLMRRAFELAFASAYTFGGAKPRFLELDEVEFKLPVNVGDLVHLQSQVLFTSEDMHVGESTAHIEVLLRVVRPETRESHVANTMNYTFGFGNKTLRQVMPATLQDAINIERRRLLDQQQRALGPE
jgi:acyl-coenzyme A thioesterase 9